MRGEIGSIFLSVAITPTITYRSRFLTFAAAVDDIVSVNASKFQQESTDFNNQPATGSTSTSWSTSGSEFRSRWQRSFWHPLATDFCLSGLRSSMLVIWNLGPEMSGYIPEVRSKEALPSQSQARDSAMVQIRVPFVEKRIRKPVPTGLSRNPGTKDRHSKKGQLVLKERG